MRGHEDDPTTSHPFDYIPLIQDRRQDPYPLGVPLCDGPMTPEDVETRLRSNPTLTIHSIAPPHEPDAWSDDDWLLHVQCVDQNGTQHSIALKQVHYLDTPDIEELEDDARAQAWMQSERQVGLVASTQLGPSPQDGFRFLALLLMTLVPNPPFMVMTDMDDVDRLSSLHLANILRIIRKEDDPPHAAFVWTQTEIYQQSQHVTNQKLLGYTQPKPAFRTTSNARRVGLPDFAVLHPPHTSRPDQKQRLAQDRFLLDVYQHALQHPLPPPGVPFQFKDYTLCWHMTREVCVDPDESNGSPIVWDNTTQCGSCEEEDFNAFLFVPPVEPWGHVQHVDLSSYEASLTKKDLKRFKRFDSDPWEDELEEDWDEDEDTYDQTKPPKKAKSSLNHPLWLYILASLIIPGSGQLLMGRTKRGILILIASLCTLCLLGLANIAAAVDAYLQATKQSSR